jgi:hypothetical protein
MATNILPNVKMSGLVLKHYSYEKAKKDVTDKLKSIDNLDALKGTVQITSLVCRCIEELVKEGNPNKVDKKAMVLEILNEVFKLTPVEVALIGKSIDYLIEAGSIVRASKLKRTYKRIKAFFFTKKLTIDIQSQSL